MKTYEVNYKDGKGWYPTTYEQVRKALRQNYFNVAPFVKLLSDGKEIETPFAFYRMKRSRASKTKTVEVKK